jgi:hypothetical protein
MNTPTTSQPAVASSPIISADAAVGVSRDQYQELWAMTPAEQIAAMWRGELTVRQLCQWSSRAQHEVPLLGGELAWTVTRTPEWAEAGNRHATNPRPTKHQKVAR